MQALRVTTAYNIEASFGVDTLSSLDMEIDCLENVPYSVTVPEHLCKTYVRPQWSLDISKCSSKGSRNGTRGGKNIPT